MVFRLDFQFSLTFYILVLYTPHEGQKNIFEKWRELQKRKIIFWIERG